MLTENDVYKAVLRALRDYDKAKEKIRDLRESLQESCAGGDQMDAMSKSLEKAERELNSIGDN